jgi:NADH-quinone oxidoreductase subunit C
VPEALLKRKLPDTSMTAQEIYEIVKTRFGEAILEAKLEGVIDPFVKVAPDKIKDVALFLRDDERLQFDLLMCLSGVDYTGGKLGVVYHLNSMKLNQKIVLKVDMTAENPRCQSVEAVWKTANWHEREAFDLYGISFDGHPDLRRILLPDDWEGHPMKKDYQVPEYYNGMKVPY